MIFAEKTVSHPKVYSENALLNTLYNELPLLKKKAERTIDDVFYEYMLFSNALGNEKIFTLYKFRTMTDKKDENGNDVTLDTIGAQGRFLCGRNKTIATSAWASDTTYADYPYRASFALPSITALSFVEIVFSPADATSGNFAPVCDTYAGGVYIYAKAVPDAAITIPTIIVWR